MKVHLAILAGLMTWACLLQAVLVNQATLTSRDSVHFVAAAQTIERQGILRTLQTEPRHPLFPAWVWLVHRGLRWGLGERCPVWAVTAQVAAAVPVVLTVVPLYFLLAGLIGTRAAAAATALFALLPEVARLGADGISDSLHLLLFCVALWLLVEVFRRRKSEIQGPPQDPQEVATFQFSIFNFQFSIFNLRVLRFYGLPLLAGLATGGAMLVRMESAVLAVSLAVTLVACQFLPGSRQPWRTVSITAACYAIGLTLIVGPWLAIQGSAAEAPQAEADSQGPAWRLPGEPMSFAVKEPARSIRQRGYPAAVTRFIRKLADAYGYWPGILALIGFWRWPRATHDADRLIQIFVLLYALAVVRFVAAEGYLESRHLLPLVVCGMGAAGYGAAVLGRWWAARIGTEKKGTVPICRNGPEAGTMLAWSSHKWGLSPFFPCAVMAMVAAACLPFTLRPLHQRSAGHRAAAEWLAAHARPGDSVLDTCGWTGLYSGHPTYRYEDAPAALDDPRLAYLVVEQEETQFDSPRGRTLRHLLQTAARPVAEFPPPAERQPKQQTVLVCRWDRGVASSRCKGAY